ncbi:MAG: phosphoadenosine phosphosulfate reductase domain-containing protein [Promethearchaeota archaeon]
MWCPSCDLPLIRGKICPVCGGSLIFPEISPPGDIRIAFPHDVELLKDTCNGMFGNGSGDYMFPTNSIVLLNKVGAIDLNYQVFIHGHRVGNLIFNVINSRYIFLPTLLGASYFFKFLCECGGFKSADKTSNRYFVKYSRETEKYVVEGKSVLVPGIEKITPDVIKGDPCILYSENGLIGAGYFIMNGNEIERALKNGRGHIAKLKEHGQPVPCKDIHLPASSKKVTFHDMIEANEIFITENEKEAFSFIRKTIARYRLPIAVAYSGGKDSLSTLILVLKATEGNSINEPISMFFADTGLELPEVLENVENTARWAKNRILFYQKSIGTRFWNLATELGPPGRDFRYCCHTLKASQINAMIDEIARNSSGGGNDKVLVFLGQRRYESFNRSEDKRIYVNSYVPNQVIASPIKNWTAFAEWLYLLREKERDPDVPINPLYFLGHDRLGCYLCPAQSIANLKNLEKTHRALYKKWMAFLEDYRNKHQLPKEWIEWGLWRFKRYKGQWKKLIEKIPGKLEYKKKMLDLTKQELKLTITKGLSPCTAGGFSIKAKFNTSIDIEAFLGWLKILDKRIIYDETSGLAFLDSNRIRFMLFADGALFLQSPDDGYDFNRFLKYLHGILARFSACTNCGVCINICPNNAIIQGENGIEFNTEKCIGLNCQKCTDHCPIFHTVNYNPISIEEGIDDD